MRPERLRRYTRITQCVRALLTQLFYLLGCGTANLEAEPRPPSQAELGSQPRDGARARAEALAKAALTMSDVTRILSAIERGDPKAAGTESSRPCGAGAGGTPS
jgi:hypothetical protein